MRSRPLLLLAILTLTWGVNWSVLKIGASELPPLWFRSIGLVIGTASFGAICVARGVSLRLPAGGLREVVALSIPNVMIWYAAATVAVTILPAGRAAILGFTMPAWAALIGLVVYRETLDRWSALGVLAAVCGVVLLVAGDRDALFAHPAGVALMLFAAVSWAWGTHGLKRTTIDLDTLALTFWMMAVGIPVVLGLSAAFELSRWRVPVGAEWWPILYNAWLVLTIGNAIWFTVARTLPPTVAGLSSMLIPAIGVFSAMALLHEVPTWRDLAALVLVSLAVASALIPRRSGRPTA